MPHKGQVLEVSDNNDVIVIDNKYSVRELPQGYVIKIKEELEEASTESFWTSSEVEAQEEERAYIL